VLAGGDQRQNNAAQAQGGAIMSRRPEANPLQPELGDILYAIGDALYPLIEAAICLDHAAEDVLERPGNQMSLDGLTDAREMFARASADLRGRKPKPKRKVR
jgi:hypothetical protein